MNDYEDIQNIARLSSLGKPKDTELWNPVEETITCGCCLGSGYIARPELFLDKYDLNARSILCKRLGCTARYEVCDDPEIVDTRATPEQCQQLHEITIRSAQQTAQSRFAVYKKALAQNADNRKIKSD